MEPARHLIELHVDLRTRHSERVSASQIKQQPAAAGVVPDSALIEASDLDRKTASGYHDILDAQRFITDAPAWRSSRLRWLTSTPERYVCDSGLRAWLAEIDFDAALWDPDARSRLLDTYVAAQLRVEAESANVPDTCITFAASEENTRSTSSPNSGLVWPRSRSSPPARRRPGTPGISSGCETACQPSSSPAA